MLWSYPFDFVFQILLGDMFIIVHFCQILLYTLFHRISTSHPWCLFSFSYQLLDSVMVWGDLHCILSENPNESASLTSLWSHQGSEDPSHYPHYSLSVWAVPPLLIRFWPFLLFCYARKWIADLILCKCWLVCSIPPIFLVFWLWVDFHTYHICLGLAILWESLPPCLWYDISLPGSWGHLYHVSS